MLAGQLRSGQEGIQLSGTIKYNGETMDAFKVGGCSQLLMRTELAQGLWASGWVRGALGGSIKGSSRFKEDKGLWARGSGWQHGERFTLQG